jgi:hypothetical protein
MSFWAGVVRAVHLLVVLIVIISPFYAEQLSLTTYVIMVPFLVLHWLSNNNVCVLTLMERKLRKTAGQELNGDDNELFLGSIISPVYDVHNIFPDLSKTIYIGTLLLWLLAVSRLGNLYMTKGFEAMLMPVID